MCVCCVFTWRWARACCRPIKQVDKLLLSGEIRQVAARFCTLFQWSRRGCPWWTWHVDQVRNWIRFWLQDKQRRRRIRSEVGSSNLLFLSFLSSKQPLCPLGLQQLAEKDNQICCCFRNYHSSCCLILRFALTGLSRRTRRRRRPLRAWKPRRGLRDMKNNKAKRAANQIGSNQPT